MPCPTSEMFPAFDNHSEGLAGPIAHGTMRRGLGSSSCGAAALKRPDAIRVCAIVDRPAEREEKRPCVNVGDKERMTKPISAISWCQKRRFADLPMRSRARAESQSHKPGFVSYGRQMRGNCVPLV